MAEGALYDHSVIRGHRIYKRVWTPVVGKELLQRDLTNSYDIFAVAIMKDGMVVGHVPIFQLMYVHSTWRRYILRGSKTLGKGLHLQVQG